MAACAAAVVCGTAAGSAQRPQFEVYLISFADARHGFASVADPKMPCPGSVCTSFLQTSSDGGRSWSTTLHGPVLLNAHVQVDALPGTSSVWAYFPCDGLSCRSRLYWSSDWGRQWRLLGHPQLERLRFFSPRDGWALTAKGILVVTHDRGRSWRRVPAQPCPPENPADIGVVAIAPVSGKHGWVLCTDIYMPEQRDGIYETRDGARSWHVRALRGVLPTVGRGTQNLVAVLDLSFTPAGRGWVWRWSSPLRTPDGGRSWRPVAGWPFSPKTSAVTWGSAVSDTLAFAVVGRRERPTLLLRTSNGGRSWTAIRRWPRP